VTCDFCRSHRVKWRYPVADREWLACDRCHEAIARDDREALLERVLFAPLPRTLPDRYESRFREQARELHEEFWLTRDGPAEKVAG
jgi:hypothetical protein